MMKSLSQAVVATMLLLTVAFYTLTRESRMTLEPRDVVAGVERMFKLTLTAFRDERVIQTLTSSWAKTYLHL